MKHILASLDPQSKGPRTWHVVRECIYTSGCAISIVVISNKTEVINICVPTLTLPYGNVLSFALRAFKEAEWYEDTVMEIYVGR